MAYLLYQGHGSFRLETDSGKVMYLDPFAGEGYDLPADLILVTHDHFDHNRVELPARKPECTLLTWKEALEGGQYGHFTLGEIQIEAVPASNTNHDPACCVGYVVTVDGISIYFAGDTSETQAMAGHLHDLHLDYALLPTDGRYNMSAAEASHCADLIGAKHSIPVHTCSTNEGKLFDPEVAQQFQAQGKLVVEPGQRIKL